ncbi:glutamate receptor ionotropic, kainate 5-like [Haliotis cracherodii]|uniref:glutamate receptor ionotropic, kainate 5-like n=1 Tax=Haliotis cracherodii TaxID=6455 RepID=UPI0039EB8E28
MHEFIAATGRGVRPRGNAGKALLASWWLLVVIMTSTYCANLIAALSAQTRQPPFLNLNELVDSDYDVGMIASGISFSILQTSERPDVQRLLGKMKKFQEEDPLLVTNDEDMHIERVKRGKYAYICYELSARRYIREDCSLAYLNERLSWEHLAFAVPKDFPLKQDIDRVMSSLWESGVLDVLWKMWNPEENLTCVTERQQKPITLREVEGGLLIVCGGIALAAIALLVEWTKHKLSSCN